MMKPRQACEVMFEDLGRVGVVSFRGNCLALDEAEVERVRARLAELLVPDRPEWVIDFTGVEYLTSRMLAVLVNLHLRLRERGSGLRLRGLAVHLQDVFTVTRLDQVLDIDR